MQSNDLKDAAVVAAAGGLFGAVLSLLAAVAQQRGGWIAIVRGASAGAIVASLVSLAIMDQGYAVSMKGAIIGLSAISADYLLAALVSVGALLVRDPLGFIVRLIGALRGQAYAPPPSPPPVSQASQPQNQQKGDQP